jgi:hypothetical protein
MAEKRSDEGANVAPVTPVSFRKTELAIPCSERDLCGLASHSQVAHKGYIQSGTKWRHWCFGAKGNVSALSDRPLPSRKYM